MSVSYNKFFHMLVDLGKTPAQIAKEAGVSRNIIMRMKRNEYISMESIEKICVVLGCSVDSILEFKGDDE